METLSIPQDLIAERAYEHFKLRGEKPGNDLDDWLKAEKELAQQAKPGATVPFHAKKPQVSAMAMNSRNGKRSLISA